MSATKQIFRGNQNKRTDVTTRFWAKVKPPLGIGECWQWQASLAAHGYGLFKINGKKYAAHRLAYEQLKGSIPPKLELDHLCRNPGCVNPYHLEPVTHKVNVRRGLASALHTHCPNGHPLSGGNVKLAKRGTRQCRTCTNEWHRRYRLRLKQNTALRARGELVQE